MTVPGLREWLFSVKTFAAAMIAFYIALSIDLDRPYWSIATVYIVSQPLSGALRSKGVYRIFGTLLGATAAIVMVPNLVDAPVLLSAALALWLGICLYFSLLDRTPRSYVFMLAGYTAAIIGFPSVEQPELIMATAAARFDEISLGILCATMIGSVVFPNSVAPVLEARLGAGVAAARRWALALLAGQGGAAEARAARQAIAGGSAEIHTLIAYLPYDASARQAAAGQFALLCDRMIYLLPVLTGVANRIQALRSAGGLAADLQALLDRLAAWLRAGPDASPEAGRGLRADLARAVPPTGTDGATILRAALLARLGELVDVLQDIGALRRRVRSGDPGLPPLALPPGAGPDRTRHHDSAMAALSGLAATLTTGLLCAFWIATEWPDGATAVLMAAVLSSFFATLDDPVPALLRFLSEVVIACVIAAVYLFVVMPGIEGFAMLALVLAPAYLVLGAFIAIPASAMRAMSIAANTTMMLTLSDAYSGNFETFLNSGIATAFAVAGAAAVTALIRSVGIDVMARRLERACRRDVARVALHRGAIRRSTLIALLLDRLAALLPRLAADSDRGAQRALLDIGVGLNVVELQGGCAVLPAAGQESVRRTLAELGAYYERRAPAPSTPALLASIDGTIAIVAGSGVQSVQRMLMALLFVRQAIAADPGKAAP